MSKFRKTKDYKSMLIFSYKFQFLSNANEPSDDNIESNINIDLLVLRQNL